MHKNEVYITKRRKVLAPAAGKSESTLLVKAFIKNLQDLGYRMSEKLAARLITLPAVEIGAIYKEIIPVLRKQKGAHRAFNPMYPNFPHEVEEMESTELYWKAMEHYWTLQLPEIEKLERPELKEIHKLIEIDLGDKKDFEQILSTLLAANSSIAEADKEIVLWFVQEYHDNVKPILPEVVPMKENIALLVKALVTFTTLGPETVGKFVKTPTDVLRVASALSGGDGTLSTPTKFKGLKRQMRRILIGVLESHRNLTEEMVAYKNEWKRLGEALHPGEFKTKFPKTAEAFKTIRDNKKIETFAGNVEAAIKETNSKKASELLAKRPGEFARRLDQILRGCKSEKEATATLGEFIKVADKVSTPVLLQLYAHFKYRGSSAIRVAFPKGNTAKVKVINALPEMDGTVTAHIAEQIRGVIVSKLKTLDPLGKVYVDPALKSYLVPFSQRTASKALHTIVRGSRLPLEENKDTIRFFTWWKEPAGCRTDIDLSAVSLDENWQYVTDLSYYNLQGDYGCHSGDITSAPRGACEFIDINLAKVKGARYIVMMLYSFTGQPLCDLPECFAGWMMRDKPKSGEIFDAKTVSNKVDIAAKATACLPVIIDTLKREIIWTDLAMSARVGGNAFNTKGKLSATCQAIAETKKANLLELFEMHQEARGTKVDSAEEAETVFSVGTGITPFDTDKIIAEFLK